MEKRLLLAFVVSAVIFAVWSALFPPPRQEAPGTQGTPVAAKQETTTAPAVDSEAEPGARDEPEGVGTQGDETAVGERVEGTEEVSVHLVNEAIDVEVTNRGAAIRSLVLRRYTSDDGEPLDLVQTVPLADRSLPLQLVTDSGPDDRLYRVEEIEGGYRLRWSDGTSSSVSKEVRLAASGYGVDVTLEVAGELRGSWVSVGTGMRDIGELEKENRFATWGDGVLLADGEIENFKRAKMDEGTTLRPGTVGFVGFQDTYFLEVLRPSTPVEEVRIRPLEYTVGGTATEEAETVQALEVAVRPEGSSLSGELFGAPKEYDLLQRVDAGMERTLDFGFFHPISVLFLKALRWIYGIVGNYGVAIILLTIGIRIILFPLMHTSTVSMRRMQKLQPKVKAVQEKYRKNKSDPQVRAKMNQEMMALYKAEGVNPMGGCLPLLVQLPILWAMYTLFAHAIELRHAPFIFWIHDLSAKDPYYITPVLMTASMWLQQRLAPQAGDPQQQRIFRLMPLVFGIMFLGFPSGLVLYWLTNNVITILQQEITLRLIGERSGGGRRGGGKGR